MPYVNIPESQLTGAIAKLVGKIEGEITSAAISKANELQNSLRIEGCNSNLKKQRGRLNSLSQSSKLVNNRLRKFQRLPNSLKAPLRGLKAAIKVILTLPIPQSVPPGFGIPVNITTKFADILHLLKELVKQTGDNINAIEHILKAPTGQLKSVQGILNRVEVSLKSCEVEKALQTNIDEGKIEKQELKNLSILDDNDVFIFSKLTPKLLSNRSILSDGTEVDSRSTNQKNAAGEEEDLQSLINQLTNNLQKLDNSNIDADTKRDLRAILDNYKDLNATTRVADTRYTHTGPDGTVYTLEIIKDPESPTIAPKRFAIAKDPSGVVVLKGPKSFSSSIDILLDEIKFRIDNQLP